LANPYKTHQIVGAKDTDKVNSETLADLLRTGYLPQVYIPTEDVLILRDAARHRTRLVKLRTQLKCMTRSYLTREGIKCPKGWSEKSMEFFRKAHPYTAQFINTIETINEQIKQMNKVIKGIAYNTYLSNLLQTVPGIGTFSSVMMLGEIGDIKRFSHPKKLIKYAGLCPGIYQSGSKSHSVKDKACNKWLKWIMYECSGRAVRMDTKYKKHYWKVYRRKDKQVARRSEARRMLTDVWFMLTHEKEFVS
jgi:transposase